MAADAPPAVTRDEFPTDPAPADTEALRQISWRATNEDEVRELDYLVRAWLRMPPARRALFSALVRELDPMG